MTDSEIEQKAREFIAADPKQRIRMLNNMSKEEVPALVRKTAELGYEPSIRALKGSVN